MKKLITKLTIVGIVAAAFMAPSAMAMDYMMFKMYFSEGLIATSDENDKKWGYRDKTGKVIIPYQYDSAGDFGSGLAPVVIDGETGFIDKTGKIVIPPKFAPFSRMVNYIGFHDGLCAVGIYKKDKNGEETIQYGYIDTKGEWVIKPQYSRAWQFSDGIASVETANGPATIDKTGKITNSSGSEDLVLYHDEKSGKYGYKNIKTGKVVIPPKYEDGQANEFSDGLAAVSIDGIKYGYIDTTGKWVIAPQFAKDYASAFSEGLAAASIDGEKSGYIDKTGKWVIEPQFDSADGMSEGIAQIGIKVQKEGEDESVMLYGYIDKIGKMIIKPAYEELYFVGDGIAKACPRSPDGENGQCGYIDETGKVLIDFKYNDVGNFFKEGVTIVRKGDKYFCIDPTGKELFEINWSSFGLGNTGG